MALQKINTVEIQIEKREDLQINHQQAVTSCNANGDFQNGEYEETPTIHMSEEEKLETVSYTVLNSDNLTLISNNMHSSNGDLHVSSNEDYSNSGKQLPTGVVNEDNQITNSNFTVTRVNSSENSSLDDPSSSDDPSFGNTTDDQLDSTHDDVKSNEHDCLLHPAYKDALSQIEEKQQEIFKVTERLKSAEYEKSVKIDELEQRLHQYERELDICKKEQEIDKRTFEAIKKESDHKYALLKKDFETANREKENIVMRYAVSEKELIDIKKERDTFVKKLKDSSKENENISEKLKTLVTDKCKLSQLLDNKSSDLANAHKEIDKLKEEINSRDIKIKWTQNKLKTEMETHKECPQQIDKLMLKVKTLEEDLSAAKLESLTLRKELQESEQSKVLESQLKEEQAKLIMEKHEHSEIDSKYKTLHQKHQLIIEENNSLSFKVQNLETERLEMEKKLSSSREETEKLSNLVTDLQSKLVEMDSLSSKLRQSEDKVNNLLTEMDRVRHQNEELLQDMSSCRAKEAEMLAFTQKLTTKNVQLQSEFSAVETKASEFVKSDEKSRTELKELRERVNELQSQLSKEKAKRDEETRLLARQIAEKKRKGELVEVELQDTKAALSQAKNKHGTVVKELQRELSHLRRKLEKIEAHGSLRQSESLNSLPESNFIQACDLPTQNLVERILKLQADNAKLGEKIEFLEEHSAHLVSEIQRKSRLLQSYILREEAGALAPSFLDNHKAEVSKHGGIMASLYGASPQDDGMSLELCLEINRKLQAVLEDTLLKNIMLKENLDTLGDEISRLNEKK